MAGGYLNEKGKTRHKRVIVIVEEVEERDPKRLAVELVSAIHKDCSIRGRRGSMVVKKGMPCRSKEGDSVRYIE